MSPQQREAVVAEARTWLGTPYHSNARIKGVGVDCAHILCGVYEAAGVLPPITLPAYAPDWHLHRSEEVYMQWMSRYCVRLPDSVTPLPGDIALFKYGRCYSHGAIVVATDTFIHSYLRRGVILTRLDEEPLAGRDMHYWTLR